MYKQKQESKFFSKFIILGLLAATGIFAYGIMHTFIRTGKEPVILIGAWFSLVGGELVLLHNIKNKEIEQKTEVLRVETNESLDERMYIRTKEEC